MQDESLAAARLTIDLGALVANWRDLVARVGDPAKVSAVVKADAYGIGLAPAAVALARAGCRTFFVAVAEEGLRLREAVPDAVIYVLAGLMPGSAPALVTHDLRPVLGSGPEIAEWLAVKAAGAATACALHIDTGMNRLGVTSASLRSIDAPRLAPALVMSHLVISEEPDDPLNRRQLAAFAAARAAFSGAPASLANSGGIYLGPDFHLDLVRPGIALYGASPGPKVPVPMHVVVTAEAQVVLVREAATGETVGYGATRRLTRPTRIAVLAAGYGDGYQRVTGAGEPAGAHVLIHGRPAPLLGRVSMDLIAVDVTDISEVGRGDWAELFGPNLPVDDVAAHAGTVGYELLTQLGRRYARRYI